MSKLSGLLTPVVLLGLISLGSSLNLNDPCTNPNGEAGRCIFFRECQPLVSIYQKPVISPEESNFVRSSQCGTSNGKALVCCAGVPVQTENRISSLPRPNQCGLDLSDRIFGGQPTALDEFPWTALIHYRKPNGNFGFHCGGSLITSRYVVTAAHCINAIPRGWQVVGVRLGEYDLKNSNKDCDADGCADVPVDMDIEKITVHENYNAQTKSQYDDIALIRFTRDVGFTDYIKPICLPVGDAERLRNNVGVKAIAAGWGRTEIASASDVKLKVQLDILDSKGCGQTYRSSGVTLRDTQLCAGGARGKDTCSGDSGGPLMIRVKTNYFLYGIVSFGPNKCGTKDVPGVYTSVVKYIDWIENNIQ